MQLGSLKMHSDSIGLSSLCQTRDEEKSAHPLQEYGAAPGILFKRLTWGITAGGEMGAILAKIPVKCVQ